MAVYRYGKKTSDINVQSDFSVKNVNDDAYIKNRPDSTLSIALDGVEQEKHYNPNTGSETINIDLSDTIIAQDNKLNNAIASLEVSRIGGSGKYISDVSEKDGKISATAVSTASTFSSTSTAAINGVGVNEALKTLDVDEVGKAGSYIEKIRETDGKISATLAVMDTTPTEDSKKAVTSGGVKAYIDDKITNLDVASVGGDGKYISTISETDGKITATVTSTKSTFSSTSTTAINGVGVNEALKTLDVAEVGSNGKYIQKIKEDNGKISTILKSFDTIISDESTDDNVPTSKAVNTKIFSEINKLNVDEVGEEGKYIEKILESSGKISTVVKAMDTAPTANSKKPVTSGGVKTYVDTQVNTEITNRKAAIAALDSTSTLTAGNYYTGMTETNGIVTLSQSAMDTTPTANSKKPVTSGGVKSYVDSLNKSLVGEDGSYIKTIKEEKGIITAVKQQFDTSISSTSDDKNAPTTKAVYDAIQSLGNVFHVRDSVETFSKLPSTGNTAGDVRNVNDTDDNYVWTGTKWDPLGGSSLINALNYSSPTASGTSTSFITSVSQSNGLITASKSNLPTASTSVVGIVKLNDAVNSTSTTTAATANAVKKVQDALNTEITNRKNAISALDATVSGTPGAGKTLTAFSETDGKVSATFGDIAITQSQVSGLVNSLAGKANSSHTHNYLPLSGGVMTGDIQYKGSKATYNMIKFIDNTDDVYGNGIAIGGGGLTIIGGGESADTVAAQQTSGGDEKMIIANDAAIDFYTNTQSGFGSAKHITMNTDGTITAAGFNGKASTAETADKATSDGSGNNIVNTYATIGNTKKWSSVYSGSTYSSGYFLLATYTGAASTGNHDVCFAGVCQIDNIGTIYEQHFLVYVRGSANTIQTKKFTVQYTGGNTESQFLYATYSTANNAFTINLYGKIAGNYRRFNTCIDYASNGDVSARIGVNNVSMPNTYSTTISGTEITYQAIGAPTATKATQDASGNVITDTYATKTALSSGLSGKSDTGHTHDDRYYTESEINTKLSGKSDTGHKHSASDITSGTLSVARGGTGQTTLNASANSLINSLTTGSSAPTDNDYYVAQYAGGGTTTTTYHRRPISALWTYIKDKIETIRLSHSKGITISNTTDVTLSSFGTEGLSIGTPTGINIGIDNNEIQARNNGAASSLYINGNGGTVYFGVGDKYYISSDGSSYNGTAAKATADGSGNNIVNTYAIKNHTHESLKRTQIASGTDLNTLTTPGEYYAIDNKSYPNAPCTNFTMQSIQLMSSYTFQILYAYSSNRIYTRSKIWGGNEHQWTDWKEHAHKDDLDKRKTLSTSTTLSNLVDNMVYYIDTAGIKITLDSSSIAGLNITFVSNKNSTIVYNSPNGSSVTKTMDVGTVLSLYSCGLGYTPNLYGTVLDINPSSTSVGQIYIKTK